MFKKYCVDFGEVYATISETLRYKTWKIVKKF